MLETPVDLHETIEYKVHGKESMSSAWEPARGLREDCSSSPILFNIYHQAVMRQTGKQKHTQARAAACVSEWGLNGDGYQVVRLRGQAHGRGNRSEAKEVQFHELLFADDTSIVGMKEEMDGRVIAIKEVMGKFEEKSNDQKEECLDVLHGRE